MRVYHVIEDSCYQNFALGLAIPNFCFQNNIECRTYHLSEFLKNIEEDNSKDNVFIVEAAFVKRLGSAKKIKDKIPHGKLIVLGGDSIQYLPLYEYSNAEVVDYHLDTMQDVVRHYQWCQINSDIWVISFSEEFVRDVQYDKNRKIIDATCLMEISNDYRKSLVNSFLDGKYNVFWGNNKFCGGKVATDDFKDHLILLYNISSCIIGTTSPSWTTMRTMKGFRDCIAPFFGSILIYDNHLQIVNNNYIPNEFLPIYDYDDFSSLHALIEEIKNKKDYYDFVEYQKESFMKISLEKQIKSWFDRYELWN